MRTRLLMMLSIACISFPTQAQPPLGLSGSDLRDALAALEVPAAEGHAKIASQFGMPGRGGGPIALPATFLFFNASGCLTAAVVPKQFDVVDEHCLDVEGAPTLASFAEHVSHSAEEVRSHAGATTDQGLVLVLTPPLSIVRNMMGEEKYRELSAGVDTALSDFRTRFPEHAYALVEPFPTPKSEP